MSRYLIEKLSPETPTPADELHVRFTVELPDLDDCHAGIDFAIDWIQRHPNAPPNTLSSIARLIRNFLPAPNPP